VEVLIDLIKNKRNMTVSGSCNPFSYLDKMSCPYPPRVLPSRARRIFASEKLLLT